MRGLISLVAQLACMVVWFYALYRFSVAWDHHNISDEIGYGVVGITLTVCMTSGSRR